MAKQSPKDTLASRNRATARARFWWREYQWIFVAVLGAAVLVCGWFGFHLDHLHTLQSPDTDIDLAAIRETFTHWPQPWQNLLIGLWSVLAQIDLIAWYQSMQLFVFQHEPALGDNGLIQLASWVAPAISAYAAILGVFTLFSDHLYRARRQTRREHIVICGLGRTGYTLARRFRDHPASRCTVDDTPDACPIPKPQHVVVIERNPENEYIQACRDLGVVVLIGDAAAPEMLKKAAVRRANQIYIHCGNDGTNADIARQIQQEILPSGCEPSPWREMVPGSLREWVNAGWQRLRFTLTGGADDCVICYVQITSASVWTAFRERTLDEASERFQFEVFNLFEIGSRHLLSTAPFWQLLRDCREVGPEDDVDLPAISAPNILLVGLGYMGRHLLVEMAYQWFCYETWRRMRWEGTSPLLREPVFTPQRMRIRVLDLNAKDIATITEETYPKLADVCEIKAKKLDVNTGAFHRGDWRKRRDRYPDAIFVALGDDAASLGAAVVLQRQFDNVPIHLLFTSTSGLPTFFGSRAGQHLFGLLEEVYYEGIIESLATLERIAEMIHETYRDVQRRKGQTPEPAWKALLRIPQKEDMVFSNRAQARDTYRKLQYAGCGIRPVQQWGQPPYIFDNDPTNPDNTVERLARFEHLRWWRERLLRGWRYAQTRNRERRLSPYLVPWVQLDEGTRDYDRTFVQHLPEYLANEGFEIYDKTD